MKRIMLLLLAVPLSLLAQVEVDTIIHLGVRVYDGFYIPEHNKLYVHSRAGVLALNCSTWQVTSIPTGTTQGFGCFAYNPVRRKLYFTASEGWVVIDEAADTLIKHLPGREYLGVMAYVPGRDQVYIGGGYGMGVLDCASDSIIKVIHSPVPGYTPVRRPAYDSVADHIIALTGNMWQGPPYFVVYDSADSLLRVIPESPRCWPSRVTFCHKVRKAYYAVADDFDGDHPGVLDADRMEIIRSFPFNGWENYDDNTLALDLRDSKVYIPGDTGSSSSNALFVIDCRTDSILKAFWFAGSYGIVQIRWLPWSNRIYASNFADRFLVVDCATDSIIAANVVLPGQLWAPLNFQLDSARERVFAIGADTGAVHVLRDVPSAIKAEPSSKPAPASPARVFPNPARDRLWLAGADAAGLYAPDGRKVLTLRLGANDIRHLGPGIYFCRAGTGTERTETKLVLTR